MGFIVSLFFGFVPMLLFAWFVYWLDRYEKEPKILLGGVFVWGAIVAAGFAFIINTFLGTGVYLVTNSDFITNFATGSIIAPPVEEVLKGFAVLVVFAIFRNEFDSILDGIIYAGIVALGFAATENTYYIYNYGYLEDGWGGLFALVFVRVILVGWQHPFYTAFFGIGLATARLNRSLVVKLMAPTVGLGLAILVHSIHNSISTFIEGFAGLLVSLIFDWSGWLFMFLVILWAVYDVQKRIRVQLKEEVLIETITIQQYHTACSAWAQTMARTTAFFNGRYLETARFYQLCGELAHKKHQYATLGDESGNLEIIFKTRATLAQLSPRVQT